MNKFFTYTYYYSISLRNKIFTHDVWSVNSLVFTMKNLLPCIAFTRQTDHRTNLKFGRTFFAEQQLLKYNYEQTKESMILNLEWLDASWAISNPLLMSYSAIPNLQLDVPNWDNWEHFWIALLFILMPNLRYISKPTSSAHVTTALCW